jgi:hypothetical protein
MSTEEKPITKDYLEIILGRLENKIDARFNALEARINGLDGKISSQRIFMIVAILGILAQIISVWVHH